MYRHSRIFIGLGIALCMCMVMMASHVHLVSAQGTCDWPVPDDLVIDFADTSLVDISTACPSDPSEFDCYECGCAIAAIVVNAIQGTGLLEEQGVDVNNLTQGDIDDFLACSINFLPQLEAVGLSVITLLPLLSCQELLENASTCVAATLGSGMDGSPAMEGPSPE